MQYYTRLLLEANAGKNNTVYDVWMQAIYAGRRDVLAWLCVEFPCVFGINALYIALCENAISRNQAWTIRWLCQKYALPKERVYDEYVCCAAIRKKQFKVLRWLRRGPFKCPWNQSKCLAEAEKRGYDEIANWIRRQRE